jgi:hypothetical protein
MTALADMVRALRERIEAQRQAALPSFEQF